MFKADKHEMDFNAAVELLSENGAVDRNQCAIQLMHLEKLGILKFNYEETKMANKVILRKEAIELIQMEGWKLFIDRLIRDKIVVLENEQSNVKVVCNCSAADICPQGKIGSQDRCSIWVNKNTLRK